MSAANAIRRQIEAVLAEHIPSALTPVPRLIRPVVPTGIRSVDEMLEGGLPVGAITEMMGAECSGRTGLAFSFLAQITQGARACVWVDVSNTLHPESAAAAGIDLTRLLWVRCGASALTNSHRPSADSFTLPEKYFVPPPIRKGLHGGGFGPHPRGEIKGLSDEVGAFLRPERIAPRCAEPQHRRKNESAVFGPNSSQSPGHRRESAASGKPWPRIEQALRVTDLLLQAGGFSAIVLDLGSTAPEHTSRVPLATWFRYRAAAERSQTSILLLTQHACAKSSAEIVLRLQPAEAICDERTVFTGFEYGVEVMRERFKAASSNVIPLKKPPQSAKGTNWQGRTPWAGRR